MQRGQAMPVEKHHIGREGHLRSIYGLNWASFHAGVEGVDMGWGSSVRYLPIH